MATRKGEAVPRHCNSAAGLRRPTWRRPARQLRTVPALLAPVLGALTWLSSPAPATEQAAPSYTSSIAPILARNCIACHSANTKMGGLLLETIDAMAKGGQRGPAILPGNSEESPLYLMVSGKMEPRMPFSAEPLGPADIELIRRWIDAGAPGPSPHDAPVRAEVGRLPRIEPAVPVKPQVFSVAYHRDGRILATGRHGGVALTDAGTGRTVASFDGLADIARAVAFSPDGRLLAAGGGHAQRGGEVKIWDIADRRLVSEISGHGDTIQALAFSPDGSTLATASYDKDIKLWDVDSGRELRTLRDHIDAVNALAFTPDGRRLVSGSADRSVKIWDPATGERLFTLGDPLDGINSIAVDPTGRLVAAGGYDRTIRVWELGEDGGKLLNVLIAHQSSILRIAYSPDGEKIVTAAADRTIKVFDAETLEELASLDGQSDWVMSLAFSPDGRRFAAGRFDGSLSVYDSASYSDQLSVNDKSRKSP